tara:strand:- start:612 stop:977 length:366 start_codon:yes stop_codon:yes gene_type:complete
MAYTGKNPFKIPRPISMPGGFEAKTLDGDLVLTGIDSTYLAIDPGGAGRNVDLPEPIEGAWYFIANKADDAEDITVRQADGSTTCATLNQNDAGIFYALADKADDAADGWALFMIFTGSIT